jgi:hypothetical protein
MTAFLLVVGLIIVGAVIIYSLSAGPTAQETKVHREKLAKLRQVHDEHIGRFDNFDIS